MVVTVVGMLTSVKAVQLKNIASEMVVSVAGRAALVKAVNFIFVVGTAVSFLPRVFVVFVFVFLFPFYFFLFRPFVWERGGVGCLCL